MSTQTNRFSDKKGFILASIGAAVGLGNALRFPGLCAKYGGGCFLFIYLCALAVLGLPLLCAEIAVGRKYKGGAPDSLPALLSRPSAKRFGEAVGWASSANSLITAIIYAGLAGWIIATAINIVPLCVQSNGLTDSEISVYFFQSVLCARSDGALSGISVFVLICIVLAWAVMFFCVRGGAGSLSKAAKITVIVPITLMTMLAVRGLLYENSAVALYILFVPDFSHLSSPELWITALGQVFFSLSVAVGVMPVYGSYLPSRTNIFTSAAVIAAADFLVSVLSSITLFTALYGCGLEDRIGDSGIITAFAVYPVVITRLFGGNVVLNGVVGVLFYSSLAMMAIQSAVSMLEAFISPLSERFKKDKSKLAPVFILLGLALSIIFATTSAVTATEIADRFVNFYNVLIFAVLECLIFAFSKRSGGIAGEINLFAPVICKKHVKLSAKLFGFSIKFLCPAVLVVFICFEIPHIFCAENSGTEYFIYGWGLSLAVIALAICLTFGKKCKKITDFPRFPAKFSRK